MPQAQRQMTGLEPQPLYRGATKELTDTLDTVLSHADGALMKYIKEPLLNYHLRSISLFYGDGEQNISRYEGFMAVYLSYSSGKPVVCCYGEEDIVCWKAKDSEAAEALRQQAKLTRYMLFTRINNRWQYNHSGQLPILRNKEVML